MSEADTVYDCLRRTYEEVRGPGKSALVIKLSAYAGDIGMNADDLRRALLLLRDQARISARLMDYPAHIPEAWEITFMPQARGYATIGYVRIRQEAAPGRPQTQGLRGQKQRLAAYAQEKGYGPVYYVSDIASANDPERDAINGLVSLCEVEQRRVIIVAPYLLAHDPAIRETIIKRLEATGAVVEFVFPDMLKDPYSLQQH